jgi:GAF domain-containing protein
MHVLLAISLAALLAATLGSLALLRRRGDPRAALLTALFALWATTEGLVLWSIGPRPLRFDLPTLAALLATAASLVCPFLVRALDRTLRERDRSESLHWNSMETVRALADLSALSSLDLEARLARLLEIGCELFGLEIGFFSRLADERCTVEALRAPRDFPLERGRSHWLDATWCRAVLEAERPFDLQDVAASGFASSAARENFPFGAYIGSVVRCAGKPIGTLAFAAPAPRSERFTATEKDLLTLLARWLGRELERRDEAPARRAPVPAAVPAARRRMAPGWRTLRVDAAPPAARRAASAQAGAGQRPPRPGLLDLNAALQRLERRLRRAAGSGVALELCLAPDLAPARDPRLPLDAVVLSLIRAAARALPRGGRVQVSSAGVDMGGSAPGVLPAVAPDAYVTLVVRASGAEVEADALADAFEAPARQAAASPDPQRLSLPALYRLLQHRGGDLSVYVERGRSVSFTVFLPRAPAEASPRRAPAPAGAPPPA